MPGRDGTILLRVAVKWDLLRLSCEVGGVLLAAQVLRWALIVIDNSQIQRILKCLRYFFSVFYSVLGSNTLRRT